MRKRFELIYGDALEKIKNIPDKSIDMVLADPPYGTTYCAWDSIIPLDLMWEQLNRVIKNDRAIVMTASQPFTTTLISSNIKMFKYCWVWEKNKCGNHMMAKYAPLKYTEDIVVFSDGGINTNCKNPVPYYAQGLEPFNKQVKGRKISREGINKYNNLGNDRLQKFTNYPKNILKFSCVNKPVHPTQKPVALMEYLIKTYTNINDTILDFAMGSGPTGVACKNTNRKFIGIDNDEYYFKLAKLKILKLGNKR